MEDTEVTLEEIKQEFGESVAFLVDGVTNEGDRRRLWGVGWRVRQGGEDAVREAFEVAVGHTKRFGVTARKVRGERFFFCLHQICFWG